MMHIGADNLPDPAATSTPSGFIPLLGTIVCWLPATVSNFYDDSGKLAALWRVRFDDASLSAQVVMPSSIYTL